MTLIVSSHRIDPLGVGSIRKEHVPGNRRHVRKEHTEPQRNHEEVQEVYRCVERGESSSIMMVRKSRHEIDEQNIEEMVTTYQASSTSWRPASSTCCAARTWCLRRGTPGICWLALLRRGRGAPGCRSVGRRRRSPR